MEPKTPEAVDVLLVGLGPVGAAAANMLGRSGVRTRVIEKSQEIFKAPRAIALDNEALRILQMAGLEDGAFATHPISKVQMRSPVFGDYARANTAGVLDGHPRLVTFYQPELEKVLRERLAAYPKVQVTLGAELLGFSDGPQGIMAEIRNASGEREVVRARFLVGADGANSFVRRHMGMEFEGRTFTQDWLVVDAQEVPNPIDHVEFICDPRRPTPHMVAPGNRQRWEFMLQPGETREEMESPEKLKELLAPWCKPEEISIERTAVYRFHARIVNSFSKGNVFLVGDAAHITPPFVGQGLVAGLRDVANLSWKLAWVCKERASPNILGSYDCERRPHARSIINLALMMGKLVMPRNRLVATAVHGFVSLLRAFPLTRPLFEDLKIKPINRFKRGLFMRGKSGSRLMRGGLLPQGLVRQGADGKVQPSDNMLGQELTLLAFACDPSRYLDARWQAEWQRVGGRVVHLHPRGTHMAGLNIWEEMTDVLVPGAAPVGWVAVVRPDRTILHDGPVAEVQQILLRTLGMLQSMPLHELKLETCTPT
jgi:3-(3-hydroxy-phenyl)propionate hydroxylase